uniref:Uncharacterized protein n=1 Tax=Oryza brachyantha TaxID=4533 RepID=J3MK39_ORYBR
ERSPLTLSSFPSPYPSNQLLGCGEGLGISICYEKPTNHLKKFSIPLPLPSFLNC